MGFYCISFKPNKWCISGNQIKTIDAENKYNIQDSDLAFYRVQFKNTQPQIKDYLKSDGIGAQQMLNLEVLSGTTYRIKKEKDEIVFEYTFRDNVYGRWN